MPKFITAHITSCMTRQDVERLVKRFAEESSDGVRNLRTQCDTVLGRMVCEWEAPDREGLVRWLAGRHVRFRGQEEWVMHVQMELSEGRIVTL